MDVCVSSWNRPAPNTFPALAKTVANYANSQLIKMEAIVQGFSEGIALDRSGYDQRRQRPEPLPRPGSNPLHGPAFRRHPAWDHPGQRHGAGTDVGHRVREESIPREMLYIADEVFFAGTAVEITPVRSIDRIAIGSGGRGPVTTAIHKAFFDLINGRTPDKYGWLTPVYPEQAGSKRPVAQTTAQGR